MSALMYGMRIAALAAYAPPDVWSNARVAERLHQEATVYNGHLIATRGFPMSPEEAKLFETSDRWIRRFIGFSERRFVPPGEGTIDLARRASELLLEVSGTDPEAFDQIVVATVTPSYLFSPSDSPLLQHELKIPEFSSSSPHELGGMTVSLACSSWVAALFLCYGIIRSGMASRVLLIGADAMSTAISWRDRAFACVLGDAGTAMELVATPPEEDWFHPRWFWNWLGGSRADVIMAPAGGSKVPLSPQDVIDYRNRVAMDGRRVREDIVPFVGGLAVEAALSKAGWRLEDFNLVTLHEANRVLSAEIVKLWEQRGFQGESIDAGGKFGNTTSASIPLAWALNPEKLVPGSRFGLFGFGGGYSASFAFGVIKHPIAVKAKVEPHEDVHSFTPDQS